MASEFTKHAEGLLRDVPKDVSETVSKAIADSMKDYKSLDLDAAGTVESCAAGTSKVENDSGRETASRHANPSLDIPFQTQNEDSDSSPRDAHEREKEFQGVFTPSYLPLLDSTNLNERRSSHESLNTPQLQSKGREKEEETLQVDASTDTRSLAASPELQKPPTPKRRNTDEVSITSDWSDGGTTRRSALRRSSTSLSRPIGSPRRVRFEVEGEEVLPTASPLPSQPVLPQDMPESSDSLGDDSEEEAGSEQIEDVDEPPPRRISSSQALRALSRNPPVDDGTQWTTVTAPPDGSASVAISGGPSQESSSENLPLANGSSRVRVGDGRGLEEQSDDNIYTSTRRKQNEKENYNDPDSSSDDDMLKMPRRKPMKGLKSTQTPTYGTSRNNPRSPTAATKSPGLPLMGMEDLGKPTDQGDGDLHFSEDDQDQLFQFDENTDQPSPPEPEQDEESEPTSPPSPRSDKPVSLSQYSQSPARAIMKPTSRRDVTPVSSNVGSYRGHPFSMPIVSDEIHAQARSLGDMTSFVGSVHGTTGPDESDGTGGMSFRTSNGIGSFTGGEPKSLTERMYMDELKEADELREKQRRK
ncbi:hypothetical protein LSUE1_G003852 [Lachnellula suecica]|uniref:Uncharacterized protein n=1 Tax=Lachnellula suecica TaxID=602035 RepID=A0A8T9CG01_9HELO|nr:hypothetical protein LSUE1_G003852 [Lachnellula suecica]